MSDMVTRTLRLGRRPEIFIEQTLATGSGVTFTENDDEDVWAVRSISINALTNAATGATCDVYLGSDASGQTPNPKNFVTRSSNPTADEWQPQTWDELLVRPGEGLTFNWTGLTAGVLTVATVRVERVKFVYLLDDPTIAQYGN